MRCFNERTVWITEANQLTKSQTKQQQNARNDDHKNGLAGIFLHLRSM